MADLAIFQWYAALLGRAMCEIMVGQPGHVDVYMEAWTVESTRSILVCDRLFEKNFENRQDLSIDPEHWDRRGALSFPALEVWMGRVEGREQDVQQAHVSQPRNHIRKGSVRVPFLRISMPIMHLMIKGRQ